MRRQGRLAILFVILVLGACAQTTDQTQPPRAPYPLENNGHMDKGVDM
jgi:hypothetical protein